MKNAIRWIVNLIFKPYFRISYNFGIDIGIFLSMLSFGVVFVVLIDFISTVLGFSSMTSITILAVSVSLILLLNFPIVFKYKEGHWLGTVSVGFNEFYEHDVWFGRFDNESDSINAIRYIASVLDVNTIRKHGNFSIVFKSSGVNPYNKDAVSNTVSVKTVNLILMAYLKIISMLTKKEDAEKIMDKSFSKRFGYSPFQIYQIPYTVSEEWLAEKYKNNPEENEE